MNFIKKYQAFLENDRKLGKCLALQTKEKYVYIYRACKKTENEFHDMDYVTLSKKFAIGHAESNHAVNEEPYHVIKVFVKTSEVYDAYNPGEYFYHGPDIAGKEFYVSLGPDEYEVD